MNFDLSKLDEIAANAGKKTVNKLAPKFKARAKPRGAEQQAQPASSQAAAALVTNPAAKENEAATGSVAEAPSLSQPTTAAPKPVAVQQRDGVPSSSSPAPTPAPLAAAKPPRPRRGRSQTNGTESHLTHTSSDPPRAHSASHGSLEQKGLAWEAMLRLDDAVDQNEGVVLPDSGNALDRDGAGSPAPTQAPQGFGGGVSEYVEPGVPGYERGLPKGIPAVGGEVPFVAQDSKQAAPPGRKAKKKRVRVVAQEPLLPRRLRRRRSPQSISQENGGDAGAAQEWNGCDTSDQQGSSSDDDGDVDYVPEGAAEPLGDDDEDKDDRQAGGTSRSRRAQRRRRRQGDDSMSIVSVDGDANGDDQDKKTGRQRVAHRNLLAKTLDPKAMTLKEMIHWSHAQETERRRLDRIQKTEAAAVARETGDDPGVGNGAMVVSDGIAGRELVLSEDVAGPSSGMEREGAIPQGPCVEIVDGRIVVNQASLTMQVAANHEGYTRVEEEHRLVNYGSHRPKVCNDRWSKEETDKFYKAVRFIGLDFELIRCMFPKRTRKAIKKKYSRECAVNGARMEEALARNAEGLDMEGYRELICDAKAITYETLRKQQAEAQTLAIEAGAPPLAALPAPGDVTTNPHGRTRNALHAASAGTPTQTTAPGGASVQLRGWEDTEEDAYMY